MTLRIAKDAAERVLHEAADRATAGNTSAKWVALIDALSQECQRAPKTHVTFLGTAMLAKAVDLAADVFAIKSAAGTPGAYSARSLAHGVLVPNAASLGIDLGRSGREPLNNQPYFRHVRVTDDMVV